MVEFIKDKNLKNFNTFNISVKAKYYVEFKNPEELKDIFEAELDGVNKYILGGGSNILFTRDFDGLIIHPTGKKIEIISENSDFALVSAEAGVEWDYFVSKTIEMGLNGAENLSYIPGTVGASPVQNIGAYGSEVKDIIEEVEVFFTGEKRIEIIKNKDCKFGYRDSVFKKEFKGKAIVTKVIYKLSKRNKALLEYGDLKLVVEKYGEPTAENVRKAVIEIRKSKLPDPKELGNSGSFFKNPVVDFKIAEAISKKYPNLKTYPAENGIKLPAGWLIDQAGWKGYCENSVGVHKNQALVLVNYGGGTGRQVIELANKIIEDIFNKFGVRLEPEVNIL